MLRAADAVTVVTGVIIAVVVVAAAPRAHLGQHRLVPIAPIERTVGSSYVTAHVTPRALMLENFVNGGILVRAHKTVVLSGSTEANRALSHVRTGFVCAACARAERVLFALARACAPHKVLQNTQE